VPDDVAIRMRKPLLPPEISRSVPRAGFAALTASLRGGSPADHCLRMFPDDEVALAIVQRAAMTGGTTTVPGWASDLVGQAVAEWLPSLYPQSAAAGLMRRGGFNMTLGDGIGSISVPGRAVAPVSLPWVGEGAPIPARSYTLNGALLSPRKMGAIVVWSRELQRTSNAETVFTALLEEDAALSLDAAYFSAIAGSATTHRGLLNGLTTLPPETLQGSNDATMRADIANLAEAVAPASNETLVFIAAPSRASAMNLVIPITLNATVLPSLAVPATRVIAIDAAALVHAFGAAPDFTAGDEATVVMNDVAADIGTPGTPPVVGAPTKSLFQTAQLALRMLVDIAFAQRRAGAVAFIDGVIW
jgi:hypothetical protein